jgi:LuxR family transcriptional regulator, transcriptional regulator of spore coat protein
MERLIFTISLVSFNFLFVFGSQKIHITNAMQKLGVKGRSQAVVELLRMGELKL